MSDASITCSHLTFAWPDDPPVFDDLSFTVGGGRTGLVAPYGAGKSTLLRLVAGDLRPTAGAVTVDGVLGHLPQDLPFAPALTVAEVLGVAPVLAALAALESGDADEEHFTTIGTDWDVEERTRAQLDRLGLGDLSLARTPGTLSGGQAVTLGLAGALAAYQGAFLVVNHDERFLAEIGVQRWLQLADGRLSATGGPRGG
jgi:ATPase subunit of ABC transporter with duplicated ATPase domains